MPTENEEVAQEVIKSLSYDPYSGIIIWKWREDKIRKVNMRLAGKRAGSAHRDGYRSVGILGSKYMAHRIAWLIKTGSWPQNQIDHLNGQRDDNRWINIREATKVENRRNQTVPRSKSGVVGVHWDSRKDKWRAQIKPEGKNIHLGLFDDLDDAIKTRKGAEKKYYKDFAPQS